MQLSRIITPQVTYCIHILIEVSLLAGPLPDQTSDQKIVEKESV